MLHHIRKLTGKINQSAIFATAGAVRGLFLERKGGTEDEFQVAGGTVLDAGCLTRDVTTDGPTLAAHVYPHIADNRLPFKAGGQVSVEHAQELEVEGTDFLHSSVDVNTANDTPLSLTGGKISTVASGQIPLFRLIKQLDPEVAGNARLLIERTALRAP